MDFPKSVPGVGLVSGRFVDEDTSTGQAGSLIPAKWANDLTLELLNLIRRAGLEPDEGKTDQLGQAVDELIAAKLDAKLVRTLDAGRQLTANDMGLLLLDASAQPDVYTLPKSDEALGIRDVILRRTDNTGNRLVIQASGTDRIKFHTDLNPQGYAFFVLMGAGDFWHLRSDGAGGWWPIARRDDSPLGNYADGSALRIPPGGYGLATGTVQAADYPWLADYAQQSGALVAVGAREAKDGRWSVSADGQTVYLPAPGSTFRRLHDLSGSRDLGTRQSQGVQELSLRAVPGSGSSTIVTGGTGGTTSPANLTVGGGTFRTSPHSNFYVGDGDETRPENITAYPLFKLI